MSDDSQFANSTHLRGSAGRSRAGLAASLRGTMSAPRDWLLWWSDGSVTNLISLGCLTSGYCHQGTWFELDTETLASLSRVWFVESDPVRPPRAARRQARRSEKDAR